MRRWPVARVWVASAVLGALCAGIVLAVHVGVGLALPATEPAFRAGEATAPSDKSLGTIVWELASSAVLIPLLETLLVFALPRLAFNRFQGRAGAILFMALMAAIGWAAHGADFYAVGQSLNFGILGGWFWALWAARGAGGAIVATSLAHGVWNGLLILAWVLWGGT